MTTPLRRAIDQVLAERSQCIGELRAYFLPEGGFTSATSFTGGMFERLAGGGDRDETYNVFTSDDLIAVSLLAIRLGHRKEIGRAVLALLDERRDAFSALLAELPVGLDLVSDAGGEVVDDGGPADVLWNALRELPHFDWVTANKLMARKRPRLIPVFDSVVRDALNPPPGRYWMSLRNELRNGLQDELLALRAEAGLPAEVSPLRVLDVVVWMRFQGGATEVD